MIRNLLTILLCLLQHYSARAQAIRSLTSGTMVSLRGLSAVSDQVIWASGSGGSVALSTDGGKTWKWMTVARYEKSDFRDIEAFSDREAVIMGITQPAVILRTTDGGENWKTVFEDSSKNTFLDAMDFTGDRGAVIGDPVSGKIFIAQSTDRGKSWEKDLLPGMEMTALGEAFFAASGSNIRINSKDQWVIVSGGKKSCLYTNSGRYPLQLNQGEESTGANSIAISPAHPGQGFIVGGDFSKDKVTYRNSLWIQLKPFKQIPPLVPPRGYRSCVEYLDRTRLICCGTTGVDVSADGGMRWKGISDKSFHVCRKAKTGQSVYLAGAQGSISRIDWNGKVN